MSASPPTGTVHAVVVFHRHGDRTPKRFPPQKLTELGKNQCFDAGSFLRSRYLNATSDVYITGINETLFDQSQTYASSPDQQLLVSSALAILQGLYPPTNNDEATVLANGEKVVDQRNGLQITTFHSITTNDQDTIWLKGDEQCPQHNAQVASYTDTQGFLWNQKENQQFYMSLKDTLLSGVFNDSEIGYQSAYMIFDYINVGALYNQTIADVLEKDSSILPRLRYLANTHEWAIDGVVSDENYASTIEGRTFAQKIVNQFKSNINVSGTMNRFSLLLGDYNTFLAFFGLADLPAQNPDFYGLPNYASAMIFELVSLNGTAQTYPEPEDLYVRFAFRNGTDPTAEAKNYKIFGADSYLMPWNTFEAAVDKVAVRTAGEWCQKCNSTADFCYFYTGLGSNNSGSSAKSGSSLNLHSKTLTPAVAGVIGAMTTLGLGILVVVVAMGIFGVRLVKNRKEDVGREIKSREKTPSDADLSESGVVPRKF